MGPNGIKPYVSLILAGGVFCVYLLTTAPVVYLGDSGEFTAAAFSLGIPHNSGYPLYTLIGKVFCLIPVGNIGFRMNVMSAFFSALAVLLVYDIILRFTRDAWCAAIGSTYLAFTPLFWSQTASAEVYPLHLFFMALMIRLLWQWDQTKFFHHLLLFVFVTGLSFGNHMQTVMLAAPVLYFIVSGDRKAIFTWPHFIAITICFVLPLTIYLYLPIRTQAGAAIHWGDPDSMERFLAHVTATAHRGTYVFSKGPAQYLERALDALKIIVTQYNVLLLISFWGWFRLRSIRWKILFLGFIVFDFAYTVFLNIISMEITPFMLPSCVVLAILMGIGGDNALTWVRRQTKVGFWMKRGTAAAGCAIPLVAMMTNFGRCDQSLNYTAYEHAVNIFRTPAHGSTLFLDGDNNVFPVAYGRMVEGMGHGISLYDRHNIIFRWHLSGVPSIFVGTWDELASTVIEEIIHSNAQTGVYFAVMNPYAISVPSQYAVAACGILKKVVLPERGGDCPDDIWKYYCTSSYESNFYRDYMNREVASQFFFRSGEHLWLSGRQAEAMGLLQAASRIGFNDTSIHSDLGVFYTDQGLFEEAYKELKMALLYHDDLGGVYNNWGYLYHQMGDYGKAVNSFRRAIRLSPMNHSFYNNLGISLHHAGNKEEAEVVFRRSLAIKENQPLIRRFMETHDLE